MPKTAHYSPFTTHRPGARLYHSTASVWLSVDPLSDKYPSVSPYVYCADNPVRLVDPDGRSWANPEEDGKIYQYLRNKAIEARDKYSTNSDEYKRIQEGIDGLDFMAQYEKKQFTFSKIDKDSWSASNEDRFGYVKREGDLFSICYMDDGMSNEYNDAKMGIAWHESIHLTRYLKNVFKPSYALWKAGTFDADFSTKTMWGITSGENHLGCGKEMKMIEEFSAFKAQLLTFPESMPTPIGTVIGHIKNDNEIYEYINSNY